MIHLLAFTLEPNDDLFEYLADILMILTILNTHQSVVNHLLILLSEYPIKCFRIFWNQGLTQNSRQWTWFNLSFPILRTNWSKLRLKKIQRIIRKETKLLNSFDSFQGSMIELFVAFFFYSHHLIVFILLFRFALTYFAIFLSQCDLFYNFPFLSNDMNSLFLQSINRSFD